MIKLITFTEMNVDLSTAYINPEDISSIAHAGDGPNNEGHTKIFMKNQVCYDVIGYASTHVMEMKTKGVTDVI